MSTHEEAVNAIKKAKNIVDALDFTTSDSIQHPDARKHKYVSFVKSGVRIIAGVALASGGWLEMNPYILWAGILLVVAELLGVVEELV